MYDLCIVGGPARKPQRIKESNENLRRTHQDTRPGHAARAMRTRARGTATHDTLYRRAAGPRVSRPSAEGPNVALHTLVGRIFETNGAMPVGASLALALEACIAPQGHTVDGGEMAPIGTSSCCTSDEANGSDDGRVCPEVPSAASLATFAPRRCEVVGAPRQRAMEAISRGEADARW